MVDGIYNDFVKIVSKERKIEPLTIINDVGALIYNSSQASDIHLINDELSLSILINKFVKQNELDDYKVIKLTNRRNTLLEDLLTGNLQKNHNNMKFECLSLRSSITTI